MITLVNAAAAAVNYEALRTEGNRTTYIGAIHTDLVKDSVVLTSNPPKRSSGSYGNRRASINYVSTVSVSTPDGSTESKDMKFELVSSIPVGASAADINEAVARIAAVAANGTLINDVAVVGKTQQ